LVIPGLYYLFGRIADGRKLLQDEVDEPLTESIAARSHVNYSGEELQASSG
jgi:hypothetical protein